MAQLVHPTSITAEDIPFIVDVRTRDEFLQEHIPGTSNIPLDTLLNTVDQLKEKPKLIISCKSGARATHACQQLEPLGFSNIVLLEGGLNGWKASKRETISLKKGFSIMQQVQIIVGTMILTGVFVKPLWFLAPIAGIGMLIAGLTNTCMMAVLLAKMPWNANLHQSGNSCPITQ